MSSRNKRKIIHTPRILILAILVVGFASYASAQSKDETQVREVLTQNTTAFANNDIATLDKIWAHDDAVTVFENGYANYGWSDYRNNHLAPEMKEISNTKYASSDVKVNINGKMAWAIFKYAISGDSGGKHFDGGGLGTAILEKRSGHWVIVHWHSSAPRRPSTVASPPK